MAVHTDDVPVEGLKLLIQRLRGHHVRRGAVDLQAVDVHHGAQVVQAVLGRRHGGLPHLALLDLAVAQQGIHPVVPAVGFARQSHAHGRGDPLPQAARGHIHALDVAHFGMARHVPFNAAELLELLQWKKAPLGQSGVERRRTVPLGEHKAIPLRGLRSVGVHPHHVEIQGCEDIQRRQGAADVSRRRAVHHIQRQQPGTRRRQCQVLNLCLFHPIHLSHFSARWPYFELSVLSISYQARAFNWRTVKNIGFSARLWGKKGGRQGAQAPPAPYF